MELIDKQKNFSVLLARLILEAVTRGYQVTMGECWRPPFMAQEYKKEGKGIIDSKHCVRIAADLNLFKYSTYLTDPEDYKEMGEYWKSLGTPELPCVWGGDWSTKDANHFEVS